MAKTTKKTTKKTTAPKKTKRPAPGPKKKSRSVYGNIADEVADIGGGGGGNFYGFKEEGEHRIRLIQFEADGSPRVFVPQFTHWNLPGDRMNLICAGRKCPICKLENTISGEIWDGPKGIKARSRVLVNAVIRGEDQDELKVAQLAPSVVKNTRKNAACMLDFLDENEPEYCDPLDEDEGFDMIVTRTGTGFSTRYKVALSRKSTPVGMDVTPFDLFKYVQPADSTMYQTVVDLLMDMEDSRGRKGKG